MEVGCEGFKVVTLVAKERVSGPVVVQDADAGPCVSWNGCSVVKPVTPA